VFWPGGHTPGKARLFPDRPKVENRDFVRKSSNSPRDGLIFQFHPSGLLQT